MGEEGGRNLYGFLGNNGLSEVDFLGLAAYALSLWNSKDVESGDPGSDHPTLETLKDAKEQLREDINTVRSQDWSKVCDVTVETPGGKVVHYTSRWSYDEDYNLGVCRTLNRPGHLVASVHARTICFGRP
jgi:hypothetical protein